MRSLPTLILCSLLATACDKGPKAVPKNNALATAESGSLSAQDDAFFLDDVQQGGKALQISSTFTGASANGREADMLLRYKVSPQVRPAVTSATELVVSINKNGVATELHRQKIDTEAMEGDLDITIEPSTSGTSLVVGLDHLNANIVTDTPTYSTVSLPYALELKDSHFANIVGMHVELVPGSYNTAVVGDRREHRFAVRVFAQYSDQISQESASCEAFSLEDVESGILQPVIGLDKNADANFVALEYGEVDIESPVTVSFSKESLGVYLVMDVSSSVVESGVAHYMLDAVSRSVISLAQFSEFNYRIFGTNVYELGSLRDINFDDPAGSGTALYYSIDTALEDIESYAPAGQNKLIIAISDGHDLASRNFYPAFESHDQVRKYIAQRIVNVQEGQNQFHNSQLQAYFLELPGAGSGGNSDDNMQQLAQLSGGTHFEASDKQGLKNSLQTITDHVGGSYDLVYSSQQTPDDTDLALRVHAGGCAFTIPLPTEYKQ
ncbi:MAG: hypothetical protein V3U65_07030 [Granulosicoccaceae bacterium]